MKQTNEEVQIYRDRVNQFEKHEESVPQYELLKNLQSELDKSILDKTSFIAKINSYFISDKPSAKNFAITLVMQAVAIISFLVRITIAIPISIVASIFIPSFLKRFAQIVYGSQKQGPEKVASDRFIKAFSMPNLFKINKLRYLAKVTQDAVTVLDKNYTNADSTENSYIFRMFKFYLKDSDLKLQDIFPIKEEDTEESYKKMIETFMKDLAIEDPEYFETLKKKNKELLKDEQIDDDLKFKIDRNKFPIDKNFEIFYKKIKNKIISKGIKLDAARAVRSIKSYPKDSFAIPISELPRNSLAMQTFIKTMNETIDNELSLSEISWKDEHLRRARDTTLRLFNIIPPLRGGAPVFDAGMFAQAYVDSMQTLTAPSFKNRVKSGELNYILNNDELIENEQPRIPPVIKRLYVERINTICRQSGIGSLTNIQVKNYVKFAQDENIKLLPQNEILIRFQLIEKVTELSHDANIKNAKQEFIKSMDDRIKEYRIEKRELADLLSGQLKVTVKPMLLRKNAVLHEDSKSKEGLKSKDAKESKEQAAILEIGKWKLAYLNKEEQLTLEYISNAKDLNLTLPQEIKQKFAILLDKLENNEREKNDKLELEIIKIGYNYPVLAEHFEIDLPALLKAKQRKIDLEGGLERKRKAELDKSAIERAMEKFFEKQAERELLKKRIKPKEGAKKSPGKTTTLKVPTLKGPKKPKKKD